MQHNIYNKKRIPMLFIYPVHSFYSHIPICKNKKSSNADSTGGFTVRQMDGILNEHQSFSGKTSSTIPRKRASIPAST